MISWPDFYLETKFSYFKLYSLFEFLALFLHSYHRFSLLPNSFPTVTLLFCKTTPSFPHCYAYLSALSPTFPECYFFLSALLLLHLLAVAPSFLHCYSYLSALPVLGAEQSVALTGKAVTNLDALKSGTNKKSEIKALVPCCSLISHALVIILLFCYILFFLNMYKISREQKKT